MLRNILFYQLFQTILLRSSVRSDEGILLIVTILFLLFTRHFLFKTQEVLCRHVWRWIIQSDFKKGFKIKYKFCFDSEVSHWSPPLIFIGVTMSIDMRLLCHWIFVTIRLDIPCSKLIYQYLYVMFNFYWALPSYKINLLF